MADLEWFIREGEKNVTAIDLMIEALFKLTVSSYEELVTHSGRAEALAAVKPYRKMSAQLFVDDLRKRGVIQGNGPDAMVVTQTFGGYIIGVPSDKIEVEIKERGTVGIQRDCPFAGIGSPDLCISLSHFQTDFEAELINPEYECIWTHHESSGDPYCRMVFKRKSDPPSVVDDLGKTLMVLPKYEVSPQQLLAARLWTFSYWSYTNACAFRDLHGEEKSKEVITDISQKIGQEIGTRLTKEHPDLKESVESVGTLVSAMQNALGQRNNFIVVSPNEVKNEVTDCSLSVHQDILCCIQYESLFKALVSAINPDFEFAYDKMISKGAKTCHWHIKNRESS